MNQHATALQWNGKGFLFIGPPGCGKSTLALELIDQGATLIADDQVILHQDNASWTAICPPILQNKIYIRDMGIMHVPSHHSTPIDVIFQSDLPAFSLSQPPALGIPIIQLDFMNIQAVNTIQTTLSCV
jgi:HPr kinase/phosphorylase